MKNCYVKVGGPCTAKYERSIKKRLDFIQEKLKIEKDTMILDVGAGYGIYISHLSKQAKLCIGVDIVRENLNIAKKKKTDNIDLFQMNSENLAFKSNLFDAVIIIEVIEHVFNDEEVIAEIYRILKPGGKLIITAPNKLFPFETHGFRIGSKSYSSKGFGFPFIPYLPEGVRRHIANAKIYTPWDFQNMLVRNKFSIITMKFLSPNLETIKINFPNMKSYINQMQKLFNYIEGAPILNNFMETIIISAKKVGE